MSNEFVVPRHARYADQLAALDEISKRGECPFCLENLFKTHNNPILLEDDNWVVTLNQWPYKNLSNHFLGISKVHAEQLIDLPAQAGLGLLSLAQQLEKRYGIQSATLFMRFGDPLYNGSSVNHLHFHIIVPDIKDTSWDKIRVKLGSKPNYK